MQARLLGGRVGFGSWVGQERGNSLRYYKGRPNTDPVPTLKEHTVRTRLIIAALAVSWLALSAPAAASDVGQIKVSKGTVTIERGGRRVPAPVGARIQPGDVVVTGRDGSVGIGFLDASLLSAGPDSVLVIDRFVFDSTTNAGAFDSSLRKGTLAVISGKIAGQSPGAMKIRTPAALLGARGTEFVVRASGPGD